MNKRYSLKVQKQEADGIILLASITRLSAELGLGFEDGHWGHKESSKDF